MKHLNSPAAVDDLDEVKFKKYCKTRVMETNHVAQSS
jgi:hypothetical protein